MHICANIDITGQDFIDAHDSLSLHGKLPYVLYDERDEWICLPVEVPYWQDVQQNGQTVCGCSVCIVRPEAERSRIPMEPSPSVMQSVRQEYNWTEEMIRTLPDMSDQSKDIMAEYLHYTSTTLQDVMDSILSSRDTGVYDPIVKIPEFASDRTVFFSDEMNGVRGANALAGGMPSSTTDERLKGFKYFEIDYDSDEQLEFVGSVYLL